MMELNNDLNKKKIRLLLCDPCWQYNSRFKTRKDNKQKLTKFGLGAGARYSLRDGAGDLSVQDLIAMGPLVVDICAPQCYCFMWATCPLLPEALEVMSAWGFDYKTVAFQWTKTCISKGKGDKPKPGIGYYTPSNMELVLLGVKGKPWHKTSGNKPDQEIRVPHPRGLDKKIIHSRKPEELQDRLDWWLGPYLQEGEKMELFATRERPEWRCLGWALTQRDIREELAELC